MLTRVGRLEQPRGPALRYITVAFGSLDALTSWADEQMLTGVLDKRDFPVVLHCLLKWATNNQ